MFFFSKLCCRRCCFFSSSRHSYSTVSEIFPWGGRDHIFVFGSGMAQTLGQALETTFSTKLRLSREWMRMRSHEYFHKFIIWIKIIPLHLALKSLRNLSSSRVCSVFVSACFVQEERMQDWILYFLSLVSSFGCQWCSWNTWFMHNCWSGFRTYQFLISKAGFVGHRPGVFSNPGKSTFLRHW